MEKIVWRKMFSYRKLVCVHRRCNNNNKILNIKQNKKNNTISKINNQNDTIPVLFFFTFCIFTIINV